ncbi:MAG: prenyltransferase [Polyangiaceae bacterium]|nr:prenyltransferase [Polyangiaceae bacterium]
MAIGPSPTGSLTARLAYALKLASWPKLLVPWLLGQALGIAAAERLNAWALVIGLGFTVFLLMFIVLLNDYADAEVDALKRQMFPDGCSPKTIPDGVLSARVVLRLGLGAGMLALALALVAQLTRVAGPPMGEDSIVAPFATLCLGLFIAYSLPPLRVNYHGGGEWLEALGVGLLLPAFNFYLQAGRLEPLYGEPSFGAPPFEAALSAGPIWGSLAGFVLLSRASAVASGLSDEESDRLGGKRTVASVQGNADARELTEEMLLGGAFVWIFLGAALLYGNKFTGVPWVLAGVVCALLFVPVRRLSKSAKTNAFAAQARYKAALHRAIWLSTALLAVSALVAARLT